MKKIKVSLIVTAMLCAAVSCSDSKKESSPAESSSASESSQSSESEESSAESSKESKEVHTKAPDAEGNIQTDGIEADFGSLEGMEASAGMAVKSYLDAIAEMDGEAFCRMTFPEELAKKEIESGDFASLLGEEEPDELTSFTVKSCTKLDDAAVEGANAYYQAMADQYGIDLGTNVPGWGYEIAFQYTTKNEPEPVDGTVTALNFAFSWKILPMDAESAAALKEMNAE